MAVTYNTMILDEVKGPPQGFGVPTNAPLHEYHIVVQISGTYATGGASVDVCQAFTGTTAQATGYGSRQGISAISVLSATAAGDYYDGTNVYSPNSASMTLSSGGSITPISAASTNNLVLIKLYSGANGTGGSEITNGTAVNGWFRILITCTTTSGSLGSV